MKNIFFDMDGTIADLYGQSDWLKCILNKDTKPYDNAQPMVDMKQFNKKCRELKKMGYTVNIISWLCKGQDEEYYQRIDKSKREWLKKHLDFSLDKVYIIPYGKDKSQFKITPQDVLFDDENNNINTWRENGILLDKVNNNEIILTKLDELLQEAGY